MFAKSLLQKALHHPQHDMQHGSLTPEDLNIRIDFHYGIPPAASVLAFDHIQRLLAIGTLDGRIKVIGGDNIEGLLISPKQLPYKNLEFLQNQGFLVGVSNENDIQVWDLEHRHVVCSLQWESNITAFSVISGTYYMYVGDEYGLLSVLKFEAEGEQILQLPYHIPSNSISEAAGISLPTHQSIVGILPQPGTSGKSVLIAYENGFIILWDVSETRVVLIRGHNDLHLKEGFIGPSNEVSNELPDDTLDHEQGEKEISSLCWVSSNGSILAVGYVDGDIMLWNTSSAAMTKGQQAGVSSNNVVKLQLSSGKRRLPVIVLHWRSQNDNAGQLFVYGGDDIGSEEVLTVLSLEWSSGLENLRCIGRVDLTLNGSFADMILVPTAGATENNQSSVLFVLTNPGQLHVYDDVSLSSLRSQPEKKLSVPAMQFPVVIPTVDPYMTVAKLSFVPTGENSSKALLKIASSAKLQATPTLSGGMKWPVTGGVPNQLSFAENTGIERVYIAGYQDGSVRLWDATYPVLSVIFILEVEVQGIKVAGASASVSALSFCPLTLSLAVGNECGLVRLYKFRGDSDETTVHFVTETKHEVHVLHQGKEPQCIAVFSLLNSPIRIIEYVNSAAKVAVGFECGRVAILDTSSFSVLFLTDSVSGTSSPIISVHVKTFQEIQSLINSPKHMENKSGDDPADCVFVLTRNAHIVVIDGKSGNMISSGSLHPKKDSTAISMYVIEGSIYADEQSDEKNALLSSMDSATKNEPVQMNTPAGNNLQEVELHMSDETSSSVEILMDSVVLLCCEDALRLYSLKSVIQGNNNTIHKVNLAKPCCWTAALKKNESLYGLIVIYQSGDVEVRSFPDLGVVEESSLMSILRWSFKASMDKTMSSSDNGQIVLANGCEMAFISLLAGENDFRIPESLPCLHDKVLAAAADAAINFSSNQKKKQGGPPGILGGIIKGLKGGKLEHPSDVSQTYTSKLAHLESIFSKFPFSDPSPTSITDDQEAVELTIDDIEIDEPVMVSSSTQKGKTAEKELEREKLFQGATTDTRPRLRTPEEIIAKYRKAGDASTAAADAKDKLLQRQEKLERISRRTEELQSGAENFASMADELVKAMESRKWWKI